MKKLIVAVAVASVVSTSAFAEFKDDAYARSYVAGFGVQGITGVYESQFNFAHNQNIKGQGASQVIIANQVGTKNGDWRTGDSLGNISMRLSPQNAGVYVESAAGHLTLGRGQSVVNVTGTINTVTNDYWRGWINPFGINKDARLQKGYQTDMVEDVLAQVGNKKVLIVKSLSTGDDKLAPVNLAAYNSGGNGKIDVLNWHLAQSVKGGASNVLFVNAIDSTGKLLPGQANSNETAVLKRILAVQVTPEMMKSAGITNNVQGQGALASTIAANAAGLVASKFHTSVGDGATRLLANSDRPGYGQQNNHDYYGSLNLQRALAPNSIKR